MMKPGQTLAAAAMDPPGPSRSTYAACAIFGGVVVALSLSAAYLLPKSYPLTVFGDGIQIILITAATILAFQNFRRGHSHVRVFWLFVALGCLMWLASLCLWSSYEIVLRREVPDIPAADILLFLKLVPLTTALALEPYRGHDSRFRAFGLLDVSILILYSLYLYAFSVFAYRMVPGGIELGHAGFSCAGGIHP